MIIAVLNIDYPDNVDDSGVELFHERETALERAAALIELELESLIDNGSITHPEDWLDGLRSDDLEVRLTTWQDLQQDLYEPPMYLSITEQAVS